MGCQHRMRQSNPETPEIPIIPTTPADPRDRAIAIIEWVASGFSGLLSGTFDHYYTNGPIWISLLVFVVVTYLVHLSLKELDKKYK
jgi:hypothetical protein